MFIVKLANKQTKKSESMEGGLNLLNLCGIAHDLDLWTWRLNSQPEISTKKQVSPAPTL